MFSKETILILGLLTMVALISSNVTARNLAETSPMSTTGEFAFCFEFSYTAIKFDYALHCNGLN